MDGHMGLANSLALKLAGINNSSIDPSGGTIAISTHGGMVSSVTM
jgi:predicted amidohydrolase YtcJ